MSGIVSPSALGSYASSSTPAQDSPQRSIGPIIADITIEEEGSDEVETTDHPVEQGAQITDHAYKRPATLLLHVAWSNSSAQANGDSNYAQSAYQKLLQLQVSRQPQTIVTGKRVYTNMILSNVSQLTNQETEQALFCTVRAKEIIIVTTQTSPVAASTTDQAMPQKTGQVQDQGSVQLNPVG